MHEVRQGIDNGESHWCFISIAMMDIVDKVAPGCTIELHKGKVTWNFKMVGFVNDKRHYTNTLSQHIIESIIKTMKQSLSTWYELLKFVGGELELSKCGWYIIDWGFDSNDNPYTKRTQHSPRIKLPCG